MKNLKNMDLQEMSKSEMEKFNGGEIANPRVMLIDAAGGLTTACVGFFTLAFVAPLVGIPMIIIGGGASAGSYIYEIVNSNE